MLGESASRTEQLNGAHLCRLAIQQLGVAVRVFISWSGSASRELALALRAWLPKVLQSVDPFVSAKDIDKGANWTTVLEQELAKTDFGIVCVTPENLRSPWLHYEAGAIAKSVEARVCPVLLGLKTEDLNAPLNQLQVTHVTEAEVGELAHALNKASEVALSPASVDEAVKVWFPQLRDAISKIEVGEIPPSDPEVPKEPEKPRTTEQDLLEEVLYRVRKLERAIPRTLESPIRGRSSRAPDDTVRRMLSDIFVGAGEIAMKRLRDGAWEVRLESISKPDNHSEIAALAAVAHRSGNPIHITDGDVTFMVDESGKVTEVPF